MEDLVSSIFAIIEQMEVGTPEQFVKAVLDRLSTFGYEATNNEEWLIAFCIQKVINHIFNSCNIKSLPIGLFYIAVDRVCGEVLYSLKNTGKLSIEDIDIGNALREIIEGDITLKFETSTSDEQRFNNFIEYLRTEGESDEICYRKLKW